MLLSVADIANANRISTRWVQKLAARFGIGTRVGRVLVFTEAEAARFRGEKPQEEVIHVPVHPAILEAMQEMSEMAGTSVEQFASDCLIEHLKRRVSDG